MAYPIDPAWTMPEENWRPTGSFHEVAPVPASAPDAGTTLCLPAINQDWLILVLGCVDQLLIPATWGPLSDAAMNQVLSWAELLKTLIASAGACEVLAFRCSGSQPQYSTDGGTTWTNLPDCFVGPPGATGATGATGGTGPTGDAGPAGPASVWRLSGCDLQYSNDGGATWTTTTGWSTSALQACLTGSPGNPQGVTVPEQACNIANWLAVQILQGALSNVATSITGGATLLAAVTSMGGLALGFAALLDPFVLAAAAFFTAAAAIGATTLNAAAADATLRLELLCAIFSAIEVDGQVTPGNFAAVVAGVAGVAYGTPAVVGLLSGFVSNLGFNGINAIQAEGSLYAGDCSGCSGAWCFHFDFTTGQHGWAVTNGVGVYVAGVGFRSTVFAGFEQLNILRTFTSSGITSVRVVGNASDIASSSTPFRLVESDSGAFPTGYSTASGPIDATVPWAHTAAGLVVTMDSQSATVPNLISHIYVRGTGACPFGTPNCV